MADINEEIVTQYLKLVKKWLYTVDITFNISQNYSNVDLLAYNPVSDTYYDIEVTYRSNFTMTATDRNGNDISTSSVKWLVELFTEYPEREKIIKQYTNNRGTTKVLVTTKQMMGKNNAKRHKLEAAFKKSMVKAGFKNLEIWYFDDMIPKIVDQVRLESRYNTELLQIIRMLNVYVNQ
jgi:hypothetical protein